MTPEIHAWLAERAEEYRYLQLVTGAGPYPFKDNRCGKCNRESDAPLGATHAGWWCRVCAYPKGGADLHEEWE